MINGMRIKSRISARVDSTTNVCHLGTTSLIEDDVYDATGKFLGEIEEIILDVRTGCVRYAVLALGGFLGIGRKRFAVPWHALTPDADYQRCVIDVALMQLMAVPVPRNDPWLQRADQISSHENAYRFRQQILAGASAPTRDSTFSKAAVGNKENGGRIGY